MPRKARSNNTLTVAFGNMQSYEKIVLNSNKLIEHVLNYLQQIGFELIHREHCSGGFSFNRL